VRQKGTIASIMVRRALFIAALGAALAGCGGSPEQSTTAIATTTTVASTTGNPATTTVVTTTTQPATTTTQAAEIPLFRVEGGAKVEGLDSLSVQVGEEVIFDVIADVSDEVHVHGFDLTFDVTAGETTRIQFTPDSTGIFEVELEAAAIHLFDLEVTP
jgi:heme/copper-type cytochrome/quinol oxidase subunit 2